MATAVLHNWLIDLKDDTKAAPPTSMTAEELAAREQRLADIVEDIMEDSDMTKRVRNALIKRFSNE